MTTEIIVAVLGILGTLVGWWIKRWWYNIDKQREIEQVQKKEQEATDKFYKKAADETAKQNTSISKQNDAAKKWFDEQN